MFTLLTHHRSCGWSAGSHPDKNWWFRTYTEDDAGNQKAVADVCFTEGDHVLGPQDEYVADCLTHLHVEQAFTCIERVGSRCDGHESANTGIATMRVRYGASGNANQQIDEYNYDKMMRSFRLLMENEKNIDNQKYIHISPRYDEGDITYWNGIYYGVGDASNAC